MINSNTHLIVENFKAFGARQRIRLAPISLIFGANSSGKSSIVHSIFFIKHAYESGSFEAQVIQNREIDLGGFASYVYKRDLKKSVHVGIELGKGETRSQIVFNISYNSLKASGELSSVNFEIGNYCSLRLNRKPSDDSGDLVLDSISITDIIHTPSKDDAKSLRNILIKARNRLHSLLGINDDRKIDSIFEHLLKLKFQIAEKDLIADVDRPQPKRFLPKGLLKDFYEGSTPFSNLKDSSEVFLGIYASSVNASRMIDLLQILKQSDYFKDDAFPKNKNELEDEINELITSSIENNEIILHRKQLRLAQIIRLAYFYEILANDLIVELLSISAKAKNELSGFTYLGPFRHYPDRESFSNSRDIGTRDAQGKYTWQLIKNDSESLKKVNLWLGRDKLDSKYELRIRQYYSDTRIQLAIRSQSPHKVLQNMRSDLRFLEIYDRSKGIFVSPRDIGVGISQVVPVIASAYALKDKSICIEQPEIHLHPKLQAELADIFIENRHRNRFILETHSEHLILRISRRMREDAFNIKGSSEDISIFYVKSSDDGSFITEVLISSDGRFISPWPDGFFEERFEELI